MPDLNFLAQIARLSLITKNWVCGGGGGGCDYGGFNSKFLIGRSFRGCPKRLLENSFPRAWVFTEVFTGLTQWIRLDSRD